MASPEKLLSFAEARECVEDHAAKLTPSGVERVSLLDAAGRYLAEDVAADRALPPFRRATRDGYAVHSEDVAAAGAALKVLGQVKAGDVWKGPAPARGECVEIMTGAPVPESVDVVIMVEHTKSGSTGPAGSQIEVLRPAKPGENIVPTGSEAYRGQVVLPRGTRLGPAQIGLAATVGKDKVTIYRRPRVAIISTGDEVVDIAAEPELQQIRNSNSYSLAAQVMEAGGDPVQLPIAPDDRARLKPLIQEGLEADLLLLSGGVSMGKHDLVEGVLEEFGAEFFFTGVFIQPGRPVVFGRAQGQTQPGKKTYFFGLPGNPVSTLVTFELFASCAVAALAGSQRRLRFASARLAAAVKTKPGLTRFLPAYLAGEPLAPTVEVVPWQGSGDMAATARANCYLVVPPNRPDMAAGDKVSVLLPG